MVFVGRILGLEKQMLLLFFFIPRSVLVRTLLEMSFCLDYYIFILYLSKNKRSCSLEFQYRTPLNFENYNKSYRRYYSLERLYNFCILNN